MKKKAYLFIAVLMIAAFCLAGCGATVNYTYDDADKYTAGDREISDSIDKLNIDYAAGDVDIKAVPGKTVSVKETANRDLEEDQKVHTRVDGSTLYVKFCASGEGMSFKDIEKHLVLEVPENVRLAGLKADLAAGDLNAELKRCGKIDIDAAAGDLKVTAGKVKEFDIDAAAGNCEFVFTKTPSDSDIDMAAGDLKIQLPEKSNLTLKMDSAAVDFSYDLPFKKKGEKYVCGTGANKMNIDCAAGDVKIACP